VSGGGVPASAAPTASSSPDGTLASNAVAPVAAVPVVVLGGSGYVAGEALRLLAGHPHLALAGVASESAGGEPVAEAFPHLAGAFPGVRFTALGDLPRLLATAAGADGRVAAICAAPHGVAARRIDELLAAAESAGVSLRVVDLSADFRFAVAAAYEKVYGHPHGAPGRLEQFRCVLPEHAALVAGGAAAAEARHIGHPGCFPTAVTLAAVPLVRLGWIEPCVHVVAVTGSTGAGRTPAAMTHHPARRSNLFAYSPLGHRHEPEMRALASAAAGTPVEIHFVPQAGPFSRGIYATLQARLLRPVAAGGEAAAAAEVAASLGGFYAAAPFVAVAAAPPRLQDVVGSNYCRIGVAVAGDRLVAFSAIDNLTKGAAGGGIQWLNRLLGFAETAGLTQPGIGWL
jgi:N-acetyl-gamma-glutamyl-phosphate reductase common form